MLKRFRESLNYWADALGMDDPAANTSSDWTTVCVRAHLAETNRYRHK
jgi:hypothetical protein